MSELHLVDDDEQTVPHDYRSEITGAASDLGYQFKNTSDLDGMNWKLNRIQMSWGNYAAVMQSKRDVLKTKDALLGLRANLAALQKSWKVIQIHKAAGRILFEDAIIKTGRHKVLFALDSILASPELQAVVLDLTPHKLRLRLPPVAGPIPIGPLVPDLVRLLRRMASRLEPIPYRSKKVKTVPALTTRCEMVSTMLKVIQIEFSGQTIRNATMSKLP